jgi:hypothetical protein|tara:strand:- start:2917 stop:3153 length:237 start_codon:yes stop_codon:yes gene_type:complete
MDNKYKDTVNQPKHYSGSIECIDAMVSAFGEEQVKNYAKINAFKYLWRAGKKTEDKEQDLAKADWYIKYAMGKDPRNV